MLKVSCPDCRTAWEIPDGGRTSYACNECGRRYPVTRRQKEDEDLGGRKPLAVASVIALFVLLVLVPLVWVAVRGHEDRPVETATVPPERLITAQPEAPPRPPAAIPELPDTAASDNLAEIKRLRAEFAKERAAKVASDGLDKAAAVYAEMAKFAEGSLKILADADRECMTLFASAGVNPKRNDSDAAVEEFRHKRAGFAETRLEKLNEYKSKLLATVNETARNPLLVDSPKGEYAVKSVVLVKRADGLLREELPDPYASYDDVVEILKNSKVVMSKRAAEKLIALIDKLPESSDAEISKNDINIFFVWVGKIQVDYGNGKLSWEKAFQYRRLIGATGVKNSQGVIKLLLDVGGDWRIGHAPNGPSMKEAYKEYCRLVGG